MSSIETCQGCINNQPNQMAHMDPGGCLYDNFCPLCETDGCENINRYIEEDINQNDDEENNFGRDYDDTHYNEQGFSIDNDTNTNTINFPDATWHNAPNGFSDIMTAAHNMLHLNMAQPTFDEIRDEFTRRESNTTEPTSGEFIEDMEEHEPVGWYISREPRRESNMFLPFNELPDADWNRITINQTINNINVQYDDEQGIVVDSKTKKELVPAIENPIDCKTCCICLEDIKKTDIFITRCGHQFHGGCMLKHMKTHDNCPMCRGVLINT